MEHTLQEVFIKGFDLFAKGRRLPPHYYKAANKFKKCRTAALGGHIQVCAEGHINGVWYNSCKHRFCPQCNEIQKARWLEKQKARLLDTPHHHIIFTLPHELERLWLLNTPLLMNLLFRAVNDTLKRLLVEEPNQRFLDALPGYICAFHSWGRSLPWHPHLHCLITDGGLDKEGRWRRPKGSCFIPVRIIRDVFKGKFLAYLKTRLDNGELRLPNNQAEPQVKSLINKLGRVKWNINIRERYDHGQGVATYMARYVRGGALRNHQLLQVTDDTVTFQYSPHEGPSGKGKKRQEEWDLPIDKFIRRYLAHVPEPGVQTIRSYGLYSSSKIEPLNEARKQMGQPSVKKPPFLEWQSYLSKLNSEWKAPKCRICSQSIDQAIPLPRATGPPQSRWLKNSHG